MKRFLFALALLMAVFTVPVYAVEVETIQVPVRELAYEDVLTAARDENIDAALYPHGVALPTKYWDLFMLSGTSVKSVEIPKAVYDFLCSNWPLQSDSDQYTYAEVQSANAFCSLATVELGDLPYNTTPVLNALSVLEGNTGLTFAAETHVASVTNYEKFLSRIEEYESMLRAPTDSEGVADNNDQAQVAAAPDSRGVVYTLGYEYFWHNLVEGYGLEDPLLLKFLATRGTYFSDFGISLVPGETAYVFNGYTTNTLDSENDVESELEGSDLFPEQGAPARVQSVGDADDYVNTVNVHQSIVGDPDENKFGPKDTSLIICIIFVVCVVVGILVSEVLKRKDDPMWRYRKW